MASDPTEPPTPPEAAGDKPPAETPAEPLKGEVSRVDAPAAGASAAAPVPPKPAAPAAARPAPAAAAETAKPPAAARPAAPAAAKPAAPAAAKPAAAAHGAEPKATPPAGPTDPPPPPEVPVPAFITSLQAALPDAVTQVSYWVGDWSLIVPAGRLLEVARFLRDTPSARFDFCSDVTASDWPPRAQRFDVVYCLYSTLHRQRVRLKVRAAEADPVPSVTPLWPAANWLEREVYDMFGVNFVGHPDRRRMLMPEDWQGHPQRKDYPLEGPGELLLESPQDWLKLRNARDEAEIE
jgi:NADH/F420H2 dehydrogenase subunit C